MDFFQYRDGQLFCEDVSLDALAGEVGTPTYVYSRQTFETHYDKIAKAFEAVDPLICYSIKSCGNINLIKLLADRGAFLCSFPARLDTMLLEAAADEVAGELRREDGAITAAGGGTGSPRAFWWLGRSL